MVKKLEKYKNHLLTIVIQMNYEVGMKTKEIASLFHITKQRVNYWLHNPIKKRKRRAKLAKREINTLVKWARDKPLAEGRVSSKNIQSRFNKLPKRMKEGGIKKTISVSTSNRVFNKYIG